jgi:hypothetical protein
MPKEPKGAVVSIRLSEEEQAHLRAIAADQGTSVSEVIRRLVASSIGPGLPLGQSAPSMRTGSGAMDEGVFWASDAGSASGSTLMVDLGKPEAGR